MAFWESKASTPYGQASKGILAVRARVEESRREYVCHKTRPYGLLGAYTRNEGSREKQNAV